jgi:hypothetical protein
MKKVCTEFSEPKVTIEMTLTEAKQIRDILGCVSVYDFEKNLRRQGTHVKPNFTENCRRLYREFFDMVSEVMASNNRL